jgi:F-type H+-transporting ATPase subunit a
MIETAPLGPHVAFWIGPVQISVAVVSTWAIMAVLTAGAWLATRNLAVHPEKRQAAVEVLVCGIAGQIRDALNRDPAPYLPLAGTLFIFLVVANTSAQIPLFNAPTARIETTGALALVVFASVHYFGVRQIGWKDHLAAYLKPTPILLPLNLLSELTRTISLMVRLFGNIMSHELVLAVVVALAGLFVPLPIMALGLLVALVQAYIFSVLAIIFIGAAIGAVKGH